MSWPYWVVFAAIFVNGVCIAWNFVLARRLYKLDLLLFELCMTTFMHRDLPAWRAWCASYGYAIKFRLVDLKDRDQNVM